MKEITWKKLTPEGFAKYGTVADMLKPSGPHLGAEPIDWAYATVCCGGSLSLTRAKIVNKLVDDLVNHARDVGAQAMVTACPLCQMNLEMRQSNRIIRQCVKWLRENPGPVITDNLKVAPPPRVDMKANMEELIHHFKLFTEGMHVPEGEVYAGVEHLGRATVDFVDAMIVVVEPTKRSLGTAAQIKRLAADIGLTELTKHAILSYPLPDQQKGEKFAAFTYLHNDAQNLSP